MENIDVLCINCENIISVDKISAHSEVCLTPTSYVLKLSAASPIKLVDFRLDKLKCSIECILQDNLMVLNEEEKNIFTKLIAVSGDVIKSQELVSDLLPACDNIVKEISSYPADSISPRITIYAERVKLMTIEKAKIVENEKKLVESSMSISFMIKQRENQLVGLDKEIKKFRQAGGDLEGIVECIDVNSVVDDLNSKRSGTSSMLSPKESLRNAEIDELDNMFKDQEKSSMERSNQDLQKYFYSKCLIMKLGFSSRDPAQFIQIPDLYRSVRQAGLPVDKWEEFIKEQFSNPEPWVKKK